MKPLRLKKISATQFNIKNHIWFIALSLSFIFCFAKAIALMISIWRNSYIYSYGMLIPLISTYIMWEKRYKLKEIQPVPDFMFGIPVFCISIVLLIGGHGLRVSSLEGFAIVMSVAGIVILVLGREFFSVLWFPIAYLLFMVPFWDRFTEHLHIPFQNFSALIGSKIMHLVGIPVYRNGIYLELPNITLEVARVCSGINQLIAVIAVAIPLAYISLNDWARRVILVIGGIVIAVVSNCFRVAFIGILAHHKMSGDLHGPYHILQGMTVSFAGFIALFFGAWILSRSQKHVPSVTVSNTKQFKVYPSNLFEENKSRRTVLFIITTLIVTGLYINL